VDPFFLPGAAAFLRGGFFNIPVGRAGPPCVQSSEFDASEPDGLSTDSDASLGQNIFNISVAQIESVANSQTA
jgi:hypothetical protein